MGNKCGTLRHVPFQETWPPTENNLGGPYWERVLNSKGLHAVEYEPPFEPHSLTIARADSGGIFSWLGLGRKSAEAAEARTARGEVGVGRGILTTSILVMIVLCCCVLTVVSCAERGGGMEQRYAGPRKMRPRGRTARRANARNAKEEV